MSIQKIRRSGALTVFFLGFTSFVISSGLSWAEEDFVPVPERKPVVDLGQAPDVLLEDLSENTSDEARVVKYSLKDIAKSLLDFGGPPVPKRKPFTVSEGPLSKDDIAHYKDIFSLQAAGKMDEADAQMDDISNMRLRGHVLYQRYMHPTAYKTSFDELRNWLALYADYPGADKIYALAERKKPKNFDGKLTSPKTARGIARLRDPMMYAGKTYRSGILRDEAQKQSVKAFGNAITGLVKGRDLEAAVKMTKEDKRFGLLDAVEQDLIFARIASGYLYTGKMDAAEKFAVRSAKRSGTEVPLAGWVAGLSFWHEGEYRNAARYFEMTASSPYASGWTSAAGSYWAARSHMRRGNVKAVSKWLNKAMEHPRTFYGLIATRALGRDFDFNWDVPTFTKDYHSVLTQIPAGARAMDLTEVGQVHLAEAELLRINPGNDQDVRDALLSYAGYAELPALALRLGSAVSGPEGRTYDAALYPKGAWKPKSGYKIDPALVHAIMRQESRFDPQAESHSGAVGLMQLMPKTASYVARQKGLALTNPETNLEIGQKYLSNLLDTKYVERDLLSLLIAYNAGPGNLSRWRSQWASIEDPLLFIELLPSGETRGYVERVLSNYWIYRLREDLPTPTLDSVVEGRKAQYAYNDKDQSFELAKAD